MQHRKGIELCKDWSNLGILPDPSGLAETKLGMLSAEDDKEVWCTVTSLEQVRLAVVLLKMSLKSEAGGE